MAITLPGLGNTNSPISVDLMYQFYDNKAITPNIRAALQKREDAEAAKPSEGGSAADSSSKFGPATKVSITDQIIRMNIANNSTKLKKDGEEGTAETDSSKKRPARYDVLAEVKKSVAEREAVAKAEKDAILKEIADKVAADTADKAAADETVP